MSSPTMDKMSSTSRTPEPLSTEKNMLWNSLGSLIRLGCNWLMTVMVVRLSSGFDAAGVLSLAMSVYNLMSPFAEYRLRTVQVTDVHGDYTASEYLGIRTVTTVLSYAIGVVYALLTCTPSAIPTVTVYVLGMFVMNYTETFRAVDQINRRMDYIGISYMLIGITNLASFSIMLYLTNSIVLAVLTIALDNIVIAILFDYPKAAQFDTIHPVFHWKKIGALLMRLFPVVLASMFANSVLTFPRQYLAAVYGDSALGIYSSVAAPAVIIQASATYIYSPLIGIFAEKLDSEKKQALSLLWKTIAAILIVSVVFMVILQLVGPWLLTFLFGEEIGSYVYLLQPALLCTLLTAFSWFMNDLLIAVRDYVGSFVGNLIATLTSLLTFHTFVDAFSMNGVSLVGIISCALSVVTLAIFFVRDYSRLPH